ERILGICDVEFNFVSFEEVTPFFKKIINLFKQMNYSEFESDEFRNFDNEIDTLILERKG
ncbi:MAG: V-type ATP synthase subunit A, partial [Bacteroidales bacterium]|nr:V-type ATP synthase subunit A [Bacteroidales bacterium]